MELETGWQLLVEMGANEYPPALAAFKRIGSKQFILYSFVGFDILRAID